MAAGVIYSTQAAVLPLLEELELLAVAQLLLVVLVSANCRREFAHAAAACKNLVPRSRHAERVTPAAKATPARLGSPLAVCSYQTGRLRA